MTKITPFAFPLLEELIRRKQLLNGFLNAFPALAEHIGGDGFKDRRKAMQALQNTDWIRWVEHVWRDLEDLSKIVAQFGPLADDYMERLSKFATDDDKEAAEKRIKDARSQMEIKGPKIWKWLHSMAIGWDGDIDQLQNILTSITNAVPCGECKKHWVEMIVQNPPKGKNAEEFFAETVAWHNQVNARLGKPEIPVVEARKLYAHAG